MIEPRLKPSLLRRMYGEPVVHFAAVALLFFGITEVAGALRSEVIEIDPREMAWRIQQLERGRGTVLDEAERALAEQAYIDEQILAVEARDRGLDDDPRIRAILSQRMLHVLSGGSIQPTEAEARAYYERHKDRYARPPSINAEVYVVGEGGPDPPTQAARARLPASPLTGVTRNDLALAYGEDVAKSIFSAAADDWVGPYPVAEGNRWFRIQEVVAAGPPPPFDVILGQLRYDWITEREEDLLQERLAELRARYSVRMSGSEP